MKKTISWECEFCHKLFHSAEDAYKHEQHCSIIDVPVKAIVLYSDSNEIVIMNYPNAKYLKNELNSRCKVNLMPNKTCDECNHYYLALQFKFDTIKKTENNDLIIYTMNLDKDYEKSCIKNLFRYRKKYFENYLIDIKNGIMKLENMIKNFNDVKIDVKENMFVETLDM